MDNAYAVFLKCYIYILFNVGKTVLRYKNMLIFFFQRKVTYNSSINIFAIFMVISELPWVITSWLPLKCIGIDPFNRWHCPSYIHLQNFCLINKWFSLEIVISTNFRCNCYTLHQILYWSLILIYGYTFINLIPKKISCQKF